MLTERRVKQSSSCMIVDAEQCGTVRLSRWSCARGKFCVCRLEPQQGLAFGGEAALVKGSTFDWLGSVELSGRIVRGFCFAYAGRSLCNKTWSTIGRGDGAEPPVAVATAIVKHGTTDR